MADSRLLLLAVEGGRTMAATNRRAQTSTREKVTRMVKGQLLRRSEGEAQRGVETYGVEEVW